MDHIETASGEINQAITELNASLDEISMVESMVILQIIEDAAHVRNKISSLITNMDIDRRK